MHSDRSYWFWVFFFFLPCNRFSNISVWVACTRAAIKNESTHYGLIHFENGSSAVSGDDGIWSESPREQLYLLIVCYRENSDCSVPVNGLTTRRLDVCPFSCALPKHFLFGWLDSDRLFAFDSLQINKPNT